jgi:hypothetical protein
MAVTDRTDGARTSAVVPSSNVCSCCRWGTSNVSTRFRSARQARCCTCVDMTDGSTSASSGQAATWPTWRSPGRATYARFTAGSPAPRCTPTSRAGCGAARPRTTATPSGRAEGRSSASVPTRGDRPAYQDSCARWTDGGYGPTTTPARSEERAGTGRRRWAPQPIAPRYVAPRAAWFEHAGRTTED